MTEEEKKTGQTQLDIAVIKVQVDAILKKQDDIMVIVKNELSMMRESYTNQVRGIEVECAKNRIERKETCAEHKSHIDNLCARTKVMEADLLLLKENFKPFNDFYDNAVKFLIGLIIVIGSMVLGMFYFMKDKLT